MNLSPTVSVQIATALRAAYEAGIVHRDLKPTNIKVRDDGTVKVLARSRLGTGIRRRLTGDEEIRRTRPKCA